MFSTAREQEKSCICLLVHFAFQLISLFLSKRIYQKYCMKNKKIVHHFHSFCVHGLLQILQSNLNESAFTTNSPVTPIKNKESLLINSCIRIKWIVIDTFTTILMLQVIEKKMKIENVVHVMQSKVYKIWPIYTSSCMYRYMYSKTCF